MIAATRKPTVEIRQYPTSDDHWLAILTTTNGRCYYDVWAGDKPSEEKVLKAWREDRRGFQPYNCTRGI